MLTKATFAAGPFSRAAVTFRRLPGVEQVTCGYTGGVTEAPTEAEVASGRTGHVEAMEIAFVPDELNFAKLLERFWDIHDPTVMDFTAPGTAPAAALPSSTMTPRRRRRRAHLLLARSAA